MDKVFIVEDNPVQQKMLQVHFEEMLGNYTVRTFTDPDTLFNHLKEKPFAVVLDHLFPDKKNKTGLDYLREIKKANESIPVIYYTTLDDSSLREKALEMGAEEYIVKNSASLVRLRTALDLIHEKKKKKGLFGKLFGK